jgi:hypothetical protein
VDGDNLKPQKNEFENPNNARVLQANHQAVRILGGRIGQGGK